MPKQVFIIHPVSQWPLQAAFLSSYPEIEWRLLSRPDLPYGATAHLRTKEDMLRFARGKCRRAGGIVAVLDKEGQIERVWEWISAAEIEEDAPVDRFIERPADPQEHSSLRRI